MDPLIEYMVHLETYVPGSVKESLDLNYPQCEILLEVRVPKFADRQGYCCADCPGEFEIVWSTQMLVG